MNININEFEKYLYNFSNLSHTTVKLYKGFINNFLYEKISIDEYIVVRDFSIHQFKLFYFSFKQFNKFLSFKNMNQINIDHITVPKINPPLPMYLNEKEIKKMLNVKICRRKIFNDRNYLIVRLFFETGIRVSELINIKHIDIINNRIRIYGKGNKERFVIISHELMHKLVNIETINEYIFTNK
jgi:site-specific recombinase XerD